MAEEIEAVMSDLGGMDYPGKAKKAMQLMPEASPKVVLLNVFGGLAKCDTVAKGVLEAAGVQVAKFPTDVPELLRKA